MPVLAYIVLFVVIHMKTIGKKTQEFLKQAYESTTI
jgi:hypothetical protein